MKWYSILQTFYSSLIYLTDAWLAGDHSTNVAIYLLGPRRRYRKTFDTNQNKPKKSIGTFQVSIVRVLERGHIYFVFKGLVSSQEQLTNVRET